MIRRIVVPLLALAVLSGAAIAADVPTHGRAHAGGVPLATAVKGDVDCSGVVDSRDALRVLQYHARLIESLACLANADVNYNFRIDSLDALGILLRAASTPFEELQIEPAATIYSIGWVDCVFQAAHVAEPSLFVDGSFFIVIRDQSDWERVWYYAIQRGIAHPGNHCHEIGDVPSLDVDFESEMVIGLIEQYSGGGRILNLHSVIGGGDGWTARATRTTPGNRCIVTAAFEYHYAFVRVMRTDLPVELAVREVSYDCDDLANFAGLS